MTPSPQLSTDDKLSAAFLAARRRRPYFASGLATLVRRMGTYSHGTMSVSRGGILSIDERFVDKYDAVELGEAVTHELLHILRDHVGRADQVCQVDRRRWNVAADCEINPNLQFSKLAKKLCFPSKYGLPDGLCAEEYYDRLPSSPLPEGGVDGHGCGGGSGGEPAGDEPVAGDPVERTPVELRRVRQEVAAATLDHASRHPGDVPGDLLRWAEAEIRPPKVRWQDKLRRLVRVGVATARGKVDYTFARPSRRTACLSAAARSLGGAQVILPSLQGRTPRLAIYVDTSASVGKIELQAAMSEVSGALRVSGVPATFMAGDAEVAGPPRLVRDASEACRLLRGGGGTDFRPLFTEVEKMRAKPDLLIVCTDGCGPAPESPPSGYPVLWVLVGEWAREPAPWGEHVFVKEDTP